LFLIIKILFTIPLLSRADIFSYVDEDGVIHFSNVPSGNYPWRLYLKERERKKTSPHSFEHFDRIVEEIASRHGVDPLLVKAIIKAESMYDARALSPKGAMGLMQLMPETARILGIQDPFDPHQNVEGGVRYLKYLIEKFGDLSLALAAYNAGPQIVEQIRSIPPYPETQSYVKKVLKHYSLLKGEKF
jgi:soluble lytic murein transglycosylase